MSCNHSTAQQALVEIVDALVDHLAEVASTWCDAAGLEPFSLSLRVTDDFVAEVESTRTEDRPPYSTVRAGGVVAAVCRNAADGLGARTVLVNSDAFTREGSWAASHVPGTLGHEVAHALIGECRRLHGHPRGYAERPSTWPETVGYTALTVCDEYLSDELSKVLIPPVAVHVQTDEGGIDTTDRAILAIDRLACMRDDLDKHVYPVLVDRVRQYRDSGADLSGMTAFLGAGIQAALIMSAHFRSGTRALADDFEGLQAIRDHPASTLYLEPFWAMVGPVLDARVAGSPLAEFYSADQTAFDVACAGVEGFWSALGVTFEPMSEGVFVHVAEPRSC